MTTGKAYDNGGPTLWSRFCRHPDFTRRQPSARERLKGGLTNAVLPGAERPPTRRFPAHSTVRLEGCWGAMHRSHWP